MSNGRIQMGALLWAIGFLLVMTGSLIRGPALGIGATIDNPHWQDGLLRFDFGGTAYQIPVAYSREATPPLHRTAHYTTPLADWDSILLLRQDLEVRSSSGVLLYQTDTTRLRLSQSALLGFTVGQVADGLVQIGAVACLIGPLLTMRRGCWWMPALWLAVVTGYLVG